MELSFNKLPFTPIKGQVIFVEKLYDEKLNKFIRHNYKWLQDLFGDRGLNFCYLPLLSEDVIRYNVPYALRSDIVTSVSNIPSIIDYAVSTEENGPLLLFALDIPVADKYGKMVLQYVQIKTKWYRSTKTTFSKLVDEIKKIEASQECYYHEKEGCTHSIGAEKTVVRYREVPEEVRVKILLNSINGKDPETADSFFDITCKTLVDEIKERIEALRNKGVNTMFLHRLIDEGEKLSRIRITKDFRIYLLDYNNLEIKMPSLPKAVYILFLRHPEGIRFKDLADYYAELMHIYKEMNPSGSKKKQEKSIMDITNPCLNSINEKCARIREAFVLSFDERLAKYYYITGKRGEAKRVELDQSMIIWEDNIVKENV